MAKGNDGNYLQHCIEVEAAMHLVKIGAGGLHIALTHGMAPFETLEKRKPGQACNKLEGALKASSAPLQSNEPALVSAYRETNASKEHYPNTAELLRTVTGKDKLSGGITETCCTKHKSLLNRWYCSRVLPVCASWRKQVGPGGILACPNDLQTPWLFTMDPMSYSEHGDADDNRLYRTDMDRLSKVLTRYVQSKQPGVAALFVYAVRPKDRDAFWKFVDDLARGVRADTRSYWLTHQGGNRNLAGLLYSGIKLSSGLNVGRI